MQEITVEFTNVFRRNLDAYLDPTVNIIFNQGGTGSSKTISIAQLLIYLVYNGIIKDSDIFIARKTTPALKLTVLKDFFDILKSLQLYDEKNHNKTDKIYTLDSCNFIFCSLDDPEKAKGMKKQLLWMNEANEFTYEDFKQFNMRNDGKTFIDFNPSEEYHWLYENILNRKDCKFIQSTYKDNPFLSKRKIQEIESYKEEDENYWQIYGMGERGQSKVKVYSNFDTYKELPLKIDETIYGLDFGYIHILTLVELNIFENDIYAKHIIFESGLLNNKAIQKALDYSHTFIIPEEEIIRYYKQENFEEPIEEVRDSITLILQENKIKNACIYADSARPDLIKEWKNADFNILESDKSVFEGIDFVKRKKIHIHEDDVMPLKQWRSYSRKVDTKTGKILEEVVKQNDDSPDAIRYATYTHLNNNPDIKIAFI